MKLLHSTLPGLTALLLVAACGGSDDSDAFKGPSVAIAELPAEYAEAACEAIERCAGELLEVFVPGEDCLERTEAQATEGLSGLEDAITAGRVTYRGDLVQRCIDELRNTSCSALPERESATCRAALDGTIEIGGDCTMNAECKGVAYCNFAAACPGTCSNLETAGGTCQDNDNCETGLVCSAETSRCVAPAGLGDLCGAGEPPCAGLEVICAGPEDMSGHCRTIDEVLAGGNGDACDPLTFDFCDSGLVCVIQSFDATAGIVATCLPKVASGAACGAAFPDQCPTSEYCAVVPDTLEGTCQPRPGEGDACAANPFGDVNVCAPSLRCNAGNCRPLANLGETCSEASQCLSEHCLDGACVSDDRCE